MVGVLVCLLPVVGDVVQEVVDGFRGIDPVCLERKVIGAAAVRIKEAVKRASEKKRSRIR